MEKLQYPRLGETCVCETLENGMTVCVVPRRGFTRYCVLCAVNYGSMDTRFQFQGRQVSIPAGVAACLEQSAFALPPTSLRQTLLAQGAVPCAFTAEDRTVFYFTGTDGLDSQLEALLRSLSAPELPAAAAMETWDTIRREHQAQERSPAWQVYHNLLRGLYGADPAESPARLTPRLLDTCHQAFCQPSAMALCAIGDVNPERIIASARVHLPAKRAPGGVRLSTQPGGSEPLVETAMAVSVPRFLLGFQTAPLPQGQDGLRMELIGELAGQLLCGRLRQEGVVQNRLHVRFQADADVPFLYCGGESGDPDAAAAAIFEEGERIRREGIPEADFQRARRICYGVRVRALDSFPYAAMQLTRGVFRRFPYYDFAQLYDTISREDVCAFLNRFVATRTAAMSVLWPDKPTD